MDGHAVADSAGFTVDDHLYPGFEVIVSVGKVSHFPVGLGVSVRINPQNLASYDFLTDTHLYITAGSGGRSSFLDASRSGGYLVGR